VIITGVHFFTVTFAALVYLSALSIAGIASSILNGLQTFLRGTKAFGWIGFVVSVLVAWGIFLYQLLGPGFGGNEILKNMAIASAISSTIIATIFLIITVILLAIFAAAAIVFSILLLLLFFIDAILALFGKKTLTQRLTEAIANSIYDVDYILADFNSEDRLNFNIAAITLVDDDQGITENNAFYLTIEITNTITYRKQANAGEARRSAFDYILQSDQVDQHDGLPANTMRDEWVKIGNSQLRYTTTIPSTEPISFGLPSINSPVDVYLTEAFAIPYQGCWAVVGIETNNCDWEYIKNSSHIDVGSELLFDILPSTISGFMDLENWTEGQINDPESTRP
jgi:hypothetical protein